MQGVSQPDVIDKGAAAAQQPIVLLARHGLAHPALCWTLALCGLVPSHDKSFPDALEAVCPASVYPRIGPAPGVSSKTHPRIRSWVAASKTVTGKSSGGSSRIANGRRLPRDSLCENVVLGLTSRIACYNFGTDCSSCRHRGPGRALGTTQRCGNPGCICYRDPS